MIIIQLTELQRDFFPSYLKFNSPLKIDQTNLSKKRKKKEKKNVTNTQKHFHLRNIKVNSRAEIQWQY